MKMQILQLCVQLLLTSLTFASNNFIKSVGKRLTNCTEVTIREISVVKCCLKCRGKDLCTGVNYEESKGLCEICKSSESEVFVHDENWSHLTYETTQTQIALDFEPREYKLEHIHKYKKDVFIDTITVCTWFNLKETYSQYSTLIAFTSEKYDNKTTCNHFYISLSNNNDNNVGIVITRGGEYYDYFSYTFSLNQWHHLCMSKEGSSFELYVNGSYAEAHSFDVETMTSDIILVGIEQDQAGNVCVPDETELFSGFIFGLNVWKTKLNGNDIATLFEGGFIRHNLIASWDYFLDIAETKTVSKRQVSVTGGN